MLSFEEMQQAKRAIEVYESYVTPQNYLKALSQVNPDIATGAFNSIKKGLEQSHPEVAKQVEELLYNEALAEEQKRLDRNAKQNAKRAQRKANGEL